MDELTNERKFCPTCGRPLDRKRKRESLARVLGGSGWRRVARNTYPMGARVAAALPDGATWERREPVRAAEVGGDVIVPLCQAAVTGLVGTLAGGALGGVSAAVAAGGLTFGVTWLALLFDHRRGLWLVERVTGRDLDGDGHAGEPPRQVRVEMVERGRNHSRLLFYDLTLGEEKLRDVARAVLADNVNFSRPGLSDVLSQSEYNRLAAEMVKKGLAVDLPGNRRELTGAGRSLLRQLLEK